MKKRVLFAVLTAALLLTVAGCGKNAAVEATPEPSPETVVAEPIATAEPTEAPTAEPTAEPLKDLVPITERVVVNGQMQSYLTGEWKDEAVAKRRPMAVMVPDNTPALPQYGITKASIIYEAPVEGRFTRLMCFLEDYDDLDHFGPVRSSRDYYIYEAMAYDAIYVNWGLARPWVEELINSSRIDNVSQALAGINNGAPEAFKRINRPGYATEFTGYLDVPGYTKAVDRLGYKKEYRDTFEQAFLFADDGCKATYDDYPDATKIYPGGTGKNSGGYGNYGTDNVRFDYNAEDGLYYRYQYGGPMIDEMNGEQVTVTNVVFKLCHGEERLPNDPKYDYLAFGVHGTGTAYVFTNGKVIKGTWKRDSDNSANKFYDEKGNEIILNQGKTWLCNIWKEYGEYIEY